MIAMNEDKNVLLASRIGMLEEMIATSGLYKDAAKGAGYYKDSLS